MSATPTPHRLIRELLVAEDLRPGDQLPTERALADRLSLSRARVRRALDQLEAEGLIVRHIGRGTFLLDDSTTDHQQISPADVMTVRRMLEPAIVRQIVAAAHQADLDEIELCVVRSESATSFSDFERWDAALHRALVAAAHSPLIEQIYAVIDRARSDALWGVMKQRSYTLEGRQSYEVDHRQILQALKERDADAAHQAVLDHVDNVTRRLLG